MRRVIVAITAAVAVSGIFIEGASARTAAQVNSTLDSLFGSHAGHQQFFEKLKEAVAADYRRTVASMIDYPFRARINGKSITIEDASHLVTDYDRIFTGKVKQAIEKQTYETLFANWQGVMIGDGEVWFTRVGNGNTVKIIAVNG